MGVFQERFMVDPHSLAGTLRFCTLSACTSIPPIRFHTSHTAGVPVGACGVPAAKRRVPPVVQDAVRQLAALEHGPYVSVCPI